MIDFIDALDKALCSADGLWVFERKYGGAPLSGRGVTWSLDRLWRTIDPSEPLGRWFRQIMLHSMRPWEWSEPLEMHRHSFGSVVIGLGATGVGRERAYVHTMGPVDADPLGKPLATVPTVAQQIFSHVPFAYKVPVGGYHSVDFERGGWTDNSFFTVTLIPNEGLDIRDWPPSVDDCFELLKHHSGWLWETRKRFERSVIHAANPSKIIGC